MNSKLQYLYMLFYICFTTCRWYAGDWFALYFHFKILTEFRYFIIGKNEELKEIT